MKYVFIYGCGGFGKEVLQIIRDLAADKEEIKCKGFIVDPEYKSYESIQGVPVYDNFNELSENDELVIAIGSSSYRQNIYKRILSDRPNIKFSTLIHPRAWLGQNVSVGAGSIICAGTLITTDITIGEHVHINIGCTIGHDSEIDDFTTINPAVSVSGNVNIGLGCEIGTGTIFLPKTQAGNWSITGAGSVITQSLPDNVTAVGVPAKIIKVRSSDWQLI